MATQFEENVKKSFGKAKEDADAIKTDVSQFKDNAAEWFRYFEESRKEMTEKIAILEKRVVELEAEKIARSLEREKFLMM